MDTLNWKTDIDSETNLPPVNWDALRHYAINLKRTKSEDPTCPITCTIAPKYNMGGLHLVRLLIFNDDSKWIARIQLKKTDSGSAKLLHEVHTHALIRERSRIPVPQIFGYESSSENPVGAAFMIMEFVPGDTLMDSFGGYELHRGSIPPKYKAKFYREVAKIQAQMGSIRLPKIGMVVQREDGTYDTDPIPGLGGPFETALEYFEAWANYSKYPLRKEYVRERTPSAVVEDLIAESEKFPQQLGELRQRIVRFNTGPFPLVHTDFWHSNMIVDKECNIISVIDWEEACTVPWETVAFPPCLSPTPPPMDAPWAYDSKTGIPKDEGTRLLWKERDDYVQMIREAEEIQNGDDMLSTILSSRDIQNVSSAMILYLNPGKIGYYCRVLDSFQEGSSDEQNLHPSILDAKFRSSVDPTIDDDRRKPLHSNA